MSISGDIRLNPVVHGWQHNPFCQNRGFLRPRVFQNFEDVGIPEPVVLGMSKEGMRSVQREQASVITLMLSRQSALVICPEAAEPLYFLRSSICAASLTLSTAAVSKIQVIILTPTENLARALYRPLEGYARFCDLGARLCSRACGSTASPSSNNVDSPQASPPANRYAGLSTRGRTTPHILVGTPAAVLAHLIDDAAPPVAQEALMVVCHAHAIFADAARELELAAIAHHVCPSQVLVCASQESEVAPQCDLLFSDLQRLYPYSGSPSRAFASRAVSSQLSPESHRVRPSSRHSDCTRHASAGAMSLPGWSAPVAPWLPSKRSGSAGRPRDEAQGLDHVDAQLLQCAHGRHPGGRSISARRVTTGCEAVRRGMRRSILPAGYMPAEETTEAGTLIPQAGPQMQLRREVKAGGIRWVPMSRHSGVPDPAHGPAGPPPQVRSRGIRSAGVNRGAECAAAVVQQDLEEVVHWWERSSPFAASPLGVVGGNRVRGGGMRMCEEGPFSVCDDRTATDDSQTPRHHGPAEDRWPSSSVKTGGKLQGQLQKQASANSTDGKAPAEGSMQRGADFKSDRDPADTAGMPPTLDGEASGERANYIDTERSPKAKAVAEGSMADAMCGSCESAATGRCSSASFAAWAQTTQKTVSPAAGAEGAAAHEGPPASSAAWRRRGAVPVPSVREVEQLSAAVRHSLSLQGVEGSEQQGREPEGVWAGGTDSDGAAHGGAPTSESHQGLGPPEWRAAAAKAPPYVKVAAAVSAEGAASQPNGLAEQQSRQRVKGAKKSQGPWITATSTWSIDAIAHARSAAAEAIRAAQMQSGKADVSAPRSSTRSPSQADERPLSWRSNRPSAQVAAPPACSGGAVGCEGPQTAAPPGETAHKVPSCASEPCVPAAAMGRSQAAREGCTVSMPPHFKALPFDALRAGAPACGTTKASGGEHLREAVPCRGAKRCDSDVLQSGDLHAADISCSWRRQWTSGTAAADAAALRRTGSSECQDEASQKERCHLNETLLRASSDAHSEFTVMAYTGSMKHSMALSPGRDGSSSGGPSVAASPPLLEPCQTLQGNECERCTRPESPRMAMPQTLSAADPTPSLDLTPERPGCMLMHDAMVMRQLCGAAPAPQASPAAISLVTAALERMAATDHTTAPPRRPAADPYSRYAQACAALVAAPESPAHAGAAKHSDAAPVSAPLATGTEAATHTVPGAGASGVRGQHQGRSGAQVLAAGESVQGCLRPPSEPESVSQVGGVRGQAGLIDGGVGACVKAATAAVGLTRSQLIGSASRQNYLRMFSQDELDLAEDLAFSCAAVEDM